MTSEILNKTKKALKIAREAGFMSAEEAGIVLKSLTGEKSQVKAQESEMLTRTELARRWKMTPRNIIKREAANKLRRLPMPGNARYSLAHIEAIEAGEMGVGNSEK